MTGSHEVRGSIPLSSTIRKPKGLAIFATPLFFRNNRWMPAKGVLVQPEHQLIDLETYVSGNKREMDRVLIGCDAESPELSQKPKSEVRISTL